MTPKTTSRDDQPIVTSNWSGGMNSLGHPSDIRPNQYYWGENVINRGGIVQTRPGYGLLASLPGTLLQGMITYLPRVGAPKMLVAIDGEVFVATYPFKSFVRLENIRFSATAEIITFTPCLRSAKRNANSTIQLIEPVTVVVMQDGRTAPAYYDGTESRHLRPEAPFLETPIGLWSAWASARLWVSRGSRVFASDPADPLSFVENTYLADGRGGFELPADCTGMIEANTSGALLAFTYKNTTAFKSYIFDRDQWRETPDFQNVILPGVGCVSGRSPVNQYNTTYWFSDKGLVDLDTAINTQQTSRLVPLDRAMARSAKRLAPNLQLIATCAFENLLIASVPNGSYYNRHTWVLDQSPTEDGAEKSWTGVWTGTRPVVWSTVNVSGTDRCYYASYDETAVDGKLIHVWQAFDITRRDNGNRVLCQMETPMVKFDELTKFRYAEIDLVEIAGPVDINVYYGNLAGPWYEAADLRVQAAIGPIGTPSMAVITGDTIVRNWKPQTRTIRTEEWKLPPDSECGPETSQLPGRSKHHQLLIQWRGRMGIKEIRMVFSSTSESKTGACSEDETVSLAIDETGANVDQ